MPNNADKVSSILIPGFSEGFQGAGGSPTPGPPLNLTRKTEVPTSVRDFDGTGEVGTRKTLNQREVRATREGRKVLRSGWSGGVCRLSHDGLASCV